MSHSSFIKPLVIVLLASPLIAGCEAIRQERTGSADPGPDAHRRDSVGVTILTYTLAHLDQAPGTRFQPEALFRVGAGDGPPGETLNQVRLMIPRPGGGAIVADDRGTVLRIYDAGGRYLGASGREGAGPGEFRRIDGLAWLPGDSLAAFERLNARVTILDPELRFVRTETLPAPLTLNGAFGVTSATRIHGLGGLGAVALRSRASDSQLTFTPPGQAPPPPPEPRIVVDTLEVLLLRPTEGQGAAPDRLMLVAGPTVQRRGNGFSSVRFGADPMLDGNATGFFYAHGSRFEVLRFDPEGRLLWITRVEAEPRPVPASVRSEILES